MQMTLFKALFVLCFGCAVSLVDAAPVIAHWIAPSGARVYFVETHVLPILDVQVDFSAGTAADPDGQSGLAALTHALLDLGVQGMDENTLSDRLADLGALLSGGADLERASVSMRTLSAESTREPALAILHAVLSQPIFTKAVFEREQARVIAALKEAQTRPGAIAGKAFWSAMYPAHAYGREATIESVAALQRDDLARFHRLHYTAQRAAVTIVGDLSRQQAEVLAQQLTGDLPVSEGGASARARADLPLPVAAEQRIAHPAAQAHVLIGMPAIKRGDPDFFPLIVGNYSLGGGGFVSRLMHEVRERRGLAYSVSSHFMPLTQTGPFVISLQTKKSQADEALSVVRRVLNDFLLTGPSEDELRAAKQNLIGSFPLRLDSNRKILENVATIGFYGLPLDYLDRYAENVEQVTAAEIRDAFARHVPLEKMSTVVVGGE